MTPGRREGAGGAPQRWHARPWLARALVLVAVLVPLAASYVATRVSRPFVAGLSDWLEVVVLGLIAVAVGLLVERGTRRVLPLAALLRMTMLFPDRAPSRLRVARQAGHPAVLAERAAGRPGESAQEAATRILGLVAALGNHDRRTRGHSERVRVFTDVVAEELHLPQEARDRLRWAALLHDVGKLDVPVIVLNKPGSLDAAEWDRIKQHPDRGAALAGPLLEWLGPWGDAIAQHHERYDGTGYPRGLSGHGISVAGRAVAVADTFEVMTAARSYKRPMSVKAARVELARVAGSQLDPECVRAFLGASLPRVLWAVGPFALLVNLPFLRGLADVGRAVDVVGAHAASQAATAAVAAGTAVVVVAGPPLTAASAADPAPSPRPVASASATPGASDEGEAPASDDGSDDGSDDDSGGSPTDDGPAGRGPGDDAGGSHGPGPSASPSPSADGDGSTDLGSDPTDDPDDGTGPSATAGPSTTPRPSVTPQPSATPPPTGSPQPPPTPVPSSTPTPTVTPTPTPPPAGGKLPAPVILSVSVPLVQILPVVVVFASVDLAATYRCRIDGDPWQTCTSPASFSGLAKGKHRIEVRAVASDGKEGEVARSEFTV